MSAVASAVAAATGPSGRSGGSSRPGRARGAARREGHAHGGHDRAEWEAAAAGGTGGAGTVGLVDLERVDGPVRVLEGRGVVLDEVLAGGGLGSAGGVVGPDVSGPVAAEGGVEDDLVVHEEVVDVAAAAAERGHGLAPAAGVRAAGRDVRGHGGAREEPDVDAGRGPLGGVDAALAVVEA